MAKILIIKLGALGDMVMATSLIKQIQQHHVKDELWLLTTPAFTGMFATWEDLNCALFPRKGLIDFCRALFWTRTNHFDRIYDLQSNDRTSILCALSGVREIAGNHPRFPYTIHPGDKYTGQCHIHERMLALLKSAGIEPVPELPCLPVSQKDRDHVKNWLQTKGLTEKPFVILHAGASDRHPEKCWPYFMALAALLESRGYTVIWSGANAESEPNRRRAQQCGIDASNAFSINQLAELGRYARFAITNDSGPMHVLSAAGIPVFAFFGPTNWRRNHAIGQAGNIITINNEAPFRSVPLKQITLELAVARLQAANLL